MEMTEQAVRLWESKTLTERHGSMEHKQLVAHREGVLTVTGKLTVP